MKFHTILTLILSIILTLLNTPVFSQDQHPATMVRMYDDNDFFNDRGKGTDDAYTNGTRIDVFFNSENTPGLFIDKWMPKAGEGSINTFGYGLMQTMYTPADITKASYQPHDYPWSAALFATHTLYAYNPEEKYDFQTELVAGLMGPFALGRQMQSLVHQVIQDPAIPQGWNNQLSTDALLNLNFTAETEVVHFRNFMEIICSGLASLGTMTDALDLSPTFLIGLMNPYFNGFMGHTNEDRGEKVQVYLKLKPGIQLVAWNSLLEGGMLNPDYTVKVKETGTDVNNPGNEMTEVRGPRTQIENVVDYFSYSVVIAVNRFSMSYSQTHNSELIKHTYAHTYGTISATYGF